MFFNTGYTCFQVVFHVINTQYDPMLLLCSPQRGLRARVTYFFMIMLLHRVREVLPFWQDYLMLLIIINIEFGKSTGNAEKTKCIKEKEKCR